jgi:predicted TIM-barrel fold metal-dependent hydrolase
MTADQIAQSEDLFARLASPFLFDHRGRISPEAGTRHPAYVVIRKLLDAGRAWVKLSSAYQDSRLGPPAYADIAGSGRASRAHGHALTAVPAYRRWSFRLASPD